uniref:Uncharacterized protein n=1 Tax=Setaria italica TaxID=4555 RepID=K3ZGN8_SETIT
MVKARPSSSKFLTACRKKTPQKPHSSMCMLPIKSALSMGVCL